MTQCVYCGSLIYDIGIVCDNCLHKNLEVFAEEKLGKNQQAAEFLVDQHMELLRSIPDNPTEEDLLILRKKMLPKQYWHLIRP